MESCILCLEINKNFVDSIATNSEKWQEYQVAELIEKHFWPLNSLLTPLNSGLCLLCWDELNSFHKFYTRIEEAHINFGRPIKVGNKTQMLEKEASTDNEDDKDLIQYGLLEPEILLGKHVEKEKIENMRLEQAHINFGRLIKVGDKTQILKKEISTDNEDDNGSFENVPIEDTSGLLANAGDLSYKDPLEKTTKSKNKTSRRKVDTKCSSNIPLKITKVESIEIKKENPKTENSDDVNRNNDNTKPDDQSDSDNASDNNDNQQDLDFRANLENNKRKTYYKRRTNRHEFDQFIGKHLKDIVCELCNTNFESFGALRQHFAGVHKQSGYAVCCNKKFYNRTRLVDHIHSHFNPDLFKCKECGRVMADRLRLESHMLRFHGATELEKKHCDVCQKPFIDGYSLKIHKLTHLPEEEKKFPCEECGKFYATTKLLKAHKEAVHLKKFVKICYICGKSISSSTDYKLHMNKHEGITPPELSCDICGLRLASERNLRLHKENQHPIGGKQAWPCPICPKISPTAMALKKHIYLMHEKGYDHKCTICEKAFKRSDHLKEHMALHTGTALYSCPWCPKTFNSSSNMHSHRKRTHPKEWEEEKLKKYSGTLPQKLQSIEQMELIPKSN